MDAHELFLRCHSSNPADANAAAAAVQAQACGRRVVVVSACLLGERTRYDGTDRHVPDLADHLLQDPEVCVLPLCPEILGGMGCPRRPVHFVRGDGDEADSVVVDDRGIDRTADLVLGAERALALTLAVGANEAWLKERSPSCGVRWIHGPSGVVAGRGAFAARLVAKGVQVHSEPASSAKCGGS